MAWDWELAAHLRIRVLIVASPAHNMTPNPNLNLKAQIALITAMA